MHTQNEHEIAEHSALAIGRALKVEREKSSMSVQDIAERTRLSSANLTALESGNFENLPGVGYIPGYIRNYCKAVGIDPAPHVASFKSLSDDVNKKPLIQLSGSSSCAACCRQYFGDVRCSHWVSGLCWLDSSYLQFSL